ncbi:hypothetical protein MSP8887_03450 [Marinomonas spartinae]|nr:hypothetical protein MSP8887_03450 [Marinomonas spartinae]
MLLFQAYLSLSDFITFCYYITDYNELLSLLYGDGNGSQKIEKLHARSIGQF